MKKHTSLWATAGIFCLGVLTTVGFSVQANAAAKCIKGERKPPYTIGWANIYSVPTWMKQTEGTIEDDGRGAEEGGARRRARRSPTPRATPIPRSSRSSR